MSFSRGINAPRSGTWRHYFYQPEMLPVAQLPDKLKVELYPRQPLDCKTLCGRLHLICCTGSSSRSLVWQDWHATWVLTLLRLSLKMPGCLINGLLGYYGLITGYFLKGHGSHLFGIFHSNPYQVVCGVSCLLVHSMSITALILSRLLGGIADAWWNQRVCNGKILWMELRGIQKTHGLIQWFIRCNCWNS